VSAPFLNEIQWVLNPTGHSDGANVVSFADGVDVIFLTTNNAGLFKIEPKSGRVRMVREPGHHLTSCPT
jgi:hypothetical protein